MNCPSCGAPLEDGARFCGICGSSIPEGVATASRAARTPQTPATPNTATMSAQDIWAANGVPTKEYNSLASGGYATPETVSSAASQEGFIATDEFKRAKADYKSARKKAGKSATPKIIAIAVVVLVAIIVGAIGAYTILNPQVQSLQQQLDDAQSQLGESNSTSNSSSTTTTGNSSTSNYSVLVGTWTGQLQSSAVYNCYGGQATPLTINVKSVDDVGNATVDLTLLFHGHEDPNNTSTTTTGDQAIIVEDVVLNFSSGSFSYDVDMTQYGFTDMDILKLSGTVTVSVSEVSMEAEVYSRYMISTQPSVSDIHTDEYVMQKQ